MHNSANWSFGDRGSRVGAPLFDMDGAMIDSRRVHMMAWRRLAGELGLGGRRVEIAERAFGRTNRTRISFSMRRIGWAPRRMSLVAIAKSADDLPRCRTWTPWVAIDFKPVENFFKLK